MPNDNVNEKEEQGTTLDLTGLKHNDEELMMNEAIDKVNQVSNLKQLEEIDSLTSNENNDNNNEPQKKVVKEETTQEPKKEETKGDVEEIKEKEEQPKEVVHKEIKITQIKKKKVEPLKEEDIVLEMSGGTVRPEKTKKIPNIKLPAFKISKTVLISLIVGLILVGAGNAFYIYGIPALKNVIEKINQNKEVQMPETNTNAPETTIVEETKPTIEEAANNDELNKQLEVNSYSSILRDLKTETENYPVEKINDELELLIIEATSEAN